MKKIAIFGSTGSIGSSLLKIIKDDKKNFKIELLTANKNYKKLIKQAKFFNVKNIVITDYNSYLIAIKLLKNTKINIDEEDEIKKAIKYEQNRQLKQYSKIYYNKVKKNIELNE